MTSGIVVGRILFAIDHLIRMEQLAISSSSDLINNSGLQIDKDRPWHVFAGIGFAKERVERVIGLADGLIGGHLTIGVDAVLEAVQLPTGIAHLTAGLADMDAYDFPHVEFKTLFAMWELKSN